MTRTSFGIHAFLLMAIGMVACAAAQGRDVNSDTGSTTVQSETAAQPSDEVNLQLLRQMIDETTAAAVPVKTTAPTVEREPVGPLPAAPILDSDTTRVSVQALLTDNQGNPLSGPTVDLVFNLYDGGSVVEGPIVLNNVDIDNGVVNAQVPISMDSFDGTGRTLGVRVNGGAELTPRVPLTAVPYAYRVNRVTSDELDDQIVIGEVASDGMLDVYNSTWANRNTVSLEGINNRVVTYADEGETSAVMGGFDRGRVLLWDSVIDGVNQVAVELDAGLNGAGGHVIVSDAEGVDHVSILGHAGTVNVEDSVNVLEALGGELNASLRRTSFGGQLLVTDPLGTNGVLVSGNPLTGGGFAEFYQGDGGISVQILADQVTGSTLTMFNDAGADTIFFDSEETSSGGALANFRNSNDDTTISLNADVSDAGRIRLRNASEEPTIQLDAESSGNDMGKLILRDSDSITAEFFSNSNLGSCLEMWDIDGTNTVSIYSSWSGGEDGGGRIRLREPDGSVAIDLNAESGISRTKVLEITGGSDLSEQFDVRGGEVVPGTVVCIDSSNPGELIVCGEAYDRTVAGIVSGAGGVKTGMMMGQRNSVADGAIPVALTGRVYVRADATNASIEPGDLLTTGDIPGRAVKVLDHDRAQGAIIGKAMTGLCDGTGLVLVLVSLQ